MLLAGELDVEVTGAVGLGTESYGTDLNFLAGQLLISYCP